MIDHGQIILVEEKAALMKKLGKKQLTLHLQAPLDAIPAGLVAYGLERQAEGCELVYTFDAQDPESGIAPLLRDLGAAGLHIKDLHTRQSSLEDIFVSLVSTRQ